MSAIVLSAVISPDVTLEVTSAALPEGAGGVALRFGLYDGPICFRVTDDEARWLTEQITLQIAEGQAVCGRAGGRAIGCRS